MQKKLSEEDIEFFESFYDPTAMMECLIPKNIRASHLWGEEDCEGIDVRPYQQPMLNYSYMYADDDRLSEKENFQKRKGAGDLINIGARNIGKSFLMVCDEFFTMIHYDGDESCVASFDYAHLKKIAQPIVDLAKYHPFFNIFKKPKVECARFTSGGFDIDTVNGHVTYGKNEKVESNDPGTAFHSLHFKSLKYEEASYMSTDGTKKRIDSGNSLGYISQISGIPDLRLGSPLGDILYDDSKKPWICRVPQFIRSDWSEKEKKERIKQYNGEESLDYLLNVVAELIEGAFGYFDIERFKASGGYNTKKSVKFFEVGKKTFKTFKKELIVEPISCEQTIIASDIGTTGSPSEVCIFFGNKDLFKWRYNIALQKLTTQEQTEVFYWLYKKLENTIVSLDCSIHPNEFILAKFDNKIQYIRIKDLEFENLEQLQVPTFNDGDVVWKKAKFIKHNFIGKMCDVSVSPGNYNVKITDNHSVMVYNENGLQKKKIQDCTHNDWLLTPKQINLKNDYLTLKYRNKMANHHTKITYSDIVLNEDLGYFLGWCCAEGCSKTTNYQLTLGDELEYAEEILKLSRKLFNVESGRIQKLTPEYHNSKTYNKTTAYKTRHTVCLGGGTGIKEFIESLVGVGSHNKRIPMEIYNSPKPVQKAFIKGLMYGDGHVQYTKEENIRNFFISASEELAKGLITLLQFFGIYSEYNKVINDHTSYRVAWSERQNLGRWEGIPNNLIGIPNGKNRQTRKTLSLQCIKEHGGTQEKINRFNKLRNFNWCFKKIKEIKTSDYSGVVYDLEVEDNHTFLAGTGNILVHNTNADGRSIADGLELLGVPKKNIVRCAFGSNMIVGFQTEEDPNNPTKEIVKTDNKGEPIYKLENTLDWANMELKKVFYNGLVEIPHNEKFMKQIQGYYCVITGNTPKYGSKTENHLVQSMQCFSIARFQNYNVILQDTDEDDSSFFGGF